MKHPKVKKLPLRTCLGCGEVKPKRDMIRVVRSKEGDISLDFTGKKSGRGAYICRSAECFSKARKAHRFEKSFGCPISEELFEGMERELSDEQN